MARWPDENGESYPAQIFGADKKKYDVYFPTDGEVLYQVEESTLSKPTKKDGKWSQLTRKDFLTMGAFTHEKHVKGTPRMLGKWVIERMGEGRHINKYVCGKKMGTKNFSFFDMGYVQRLLLKEAFPFDKLYT